MWKLLKPTLPLILLSLTTSCTVLPDARTDTTPFKTFDDVRVAVESLVPMKSTRASLVQAGFDPAKHPNTRLLTHTEVARRFLPSSLLRREDLDAGVVACLEARNACHGVEIMSAKLTRKRDGNALLDLFNFKRRTETTGWRITVIVLLVNDLVVYRAWNGQPNINEVVVTEHPLGPFQNIDPAPADGQ